MVIEFHICNSSLKGEYSVIGRSIIIHEYYGNNEKGIDSGARIAGWNIIE